MAGIERIKITGSRIKRAEDAALWWDHAAQLYRQEFAKLGCELEPGYEVKECAPADFLAGYDRSLGIDVILRFSNGMSATLQEKFLFTEFETITVEYMQDPKTDERGDWFNMRAQYYFVGYDEIVRLFNEEVRVNSRAKSIERTAAQSKNNTALVEQVIANPQFRTWVLLDWGFVQRCTMQGKIAWNEKPNTKDYARATFRYTLIKDLPHDCVVASGGYSRLAR